MVVIRNGQLILGTTQVTHHTRKEIRALSCFFHSELFISLKSCTIVNFVKSFHAFVLNSSLKSFLKYN